MTSGVKFSVIGKIYFVEYLSCLVLDGLNLNMVRRKLPLSLSGCPLNPLETVQSDGMTSPGVKEVTELLHQTLAAVEQARGQPQQLPAPLLTPSHGIVSQLLHDLTVHLVA